MDEEVHHWIKRQAAAALSRLPGLGEDNRVLAAIVSLIGNDEIRLDDRCDLAALLANLSYEGAEVDGSEAAKQLVLLADGVGQDESENAREFQDMHLPGRRRRGFGGIGARRRTNEDDLKFERRQLLARLTGLQSGLGAVEPLLADEARSQVNDVSSAVQTVLTAARDEKTLDLNLTEQVVSMSAEINRVATAWGAPVADAVTAESEEALFQ